MSFMPGGPSIPGQNGIFDLLKYTNLFGGKKKPTPSLGGVSAQGVPSDLAGPVQGYNQAMQSTPVDPMAEKPKTPWMQREGPLGLDKQTWLMGGLGLLAGNKNTGPQMMLQNLSRGMAGQQARQKEAKQQAKMDKFRSGLTPEQAALFDVNPGAVAGGMAEQMFAQDSAPEAYTLAPGAVRFGANNKIIASNPKPDEVQVAGSYLTPKQEVEIFGEDRPGTFYQEPGKAPKLIEGSFDEPNPDAGLPDASAEGQFRREFNSLTKDFRAVHESYNRITATDTSTPAGQMGLIFQYMKMLDPGSTVREGEYATAQNTTGVPGQVLNAYNRALEGKFLTPVQITDFESQAENLYNRAASLYGQKVNDYRRLAGEYNFSPDRTVVDVRGFFDNSPQGGASDPPPPGVDPADWEYMTPEEKAAWGTGR